MVTFIKGLKFFQHRKGDREGDNVCGIEEFFWGTIEDPEIRVTERNLLGMVQTGLYPKYLDNLDPSINTSSCIELYINQETTATINNLVHEFDANNLLTITPRGKPILTVYGPVGETIVGGPKVMYVRKYILHGEYLFLFRTRYVFKGAGAEFLWIKSFLAGSSLDISNWVNIYAPEFKQIPCIIEKVM